MSVVNKEIGQQKISEFVLLFEHSVLNKVVFDTDNYNKSFIECI